MKASLPTFAVISVLASSLALVRQGNEAFERGDVAAALALYDRAEPTTDDPGLIAFNKATALYRLGQHRDAELHYRRCLEDASGQRRAGALYGLGNSLVQQAESRGAVALREAIRCYEQCLALNQELPDADDIRHNLELTRLLLLKLPSGQREPERGPGQSDDGRDEPPTRPQRPKRAQANGDKQVGVRPDPNGERVPVEAAPGQKQVPVEQPPPPGAGNLPPVPDRGEVSPLPPEDAAAHLERALQRILQERREYRARSVKSPAGVKDW